MDSFVSIDAALTTPAARGAPDPVSNTPSNSRKRPFTVASIMCFMVNATLERGASIDHLPEGTTLAPLAPSTTDIQKPSLIG